MLGPGLPTNPVAPYTTRQTAVQQHCQVKRQAVDNIKVDVQRCPMLGIVLSAAVQGRPVLGACGALLTPHTVQ